MRAWSALVQLCDRREPALSLALFRIAVGCTTCLLWSMPIATGNVETFWVDAAHGGMFPSHRSFLIDALGGATPGVVWTVLGCALAAGACTAVGLFGRLAPLVAVQCHAALYTTSVSASSDILTANALWLLVLANANATWSLDSRLRHGSWARPDVLVPAWPRYLAIFQLVTVYTCTGLQKLGENWGHAGDYSALYYILQHPNWHRVDMSWLAYVYPLTQAATLVVVYWEMAAPLLLLFYYYRYTPAAGGRLRAFCLRHDPRLWFLAMGVSLHLGIAATMEVGVFSYITLSFYFCCFHPREWAALAARVRAGVRVQRPLPA